MEVRCNNVNDALQKFAEIFYTGADGKLDVTSSRAGEVVQILEPCTVYYEQPRQRVLFHPVRDANPMFHLFEAIWMLSGSNRVAPLSLFNSKIADITSDDGVTVPGAYGYRWRRAFAMDQIYLLINHLRNKPNTRRAVLQMWDSQCDLQNVDWSKDVCCNLCCCFSIENGQAANGENDCPKLLHMTVFNRSNDVLWGMLGANYVHFSFLQEYVALALGLEVGCYIQITNNLHGYTERWKPEKLLGRPFDYSDGVAAPVTNEPTPYLYASTSWAERDDTFVDAEQAQFDRDCKLLVDQLCNLPPTQVRNLPTASNTPELEPSTMTFVVQSEFKNQFIQGVVVPATNCMLAFRAGFGHLAYYWAQEIASWDWRIATVDWLDRRFKK